ncbi:MAG: NUDIX hydrolase [Gemmatimonadetes bacterium]|nr:NUDIX hydrolase [Gemmatimonadota bacterium]
MTREPSERPRNLLEAGAIASREIFDGRIVHLTVDDVRFPDGSTGQLEMIRHSGAAAVLPLLGEPADPDPEILLVRQYRYAAAGYLYEVPAGRPAYTGEPWRDCAARELREETGYRADHLERLTMIYTTPGFTDERIHLYLARGLTPGETAHDQDEFMEMERMPLSRALTMVRDGMIVDAKTICTLLYAATFNLAPRTPSLPAT